MTEKELFPRVLIDHREFAILRSLKNACRPEVVHLPVGDLLIAGKMDALVLERKTVPDFISSIRSNRLWSQLLALMKHNEILGHKVVRRILVIHGGFWEYTNVSNVNEERFWASVFGALMQIEFIYDTPKDLAIVEPIQVVVDLFCLGGAGRDGAMKLYQSLTESNAKKQKEFQTKGVQQRKNKDNHKVLWEARQCQTWRAYRAFQYAQGLSTSAQRTCTLCGQEDERKIRANLQVYGV